MPFRLDQNKERGAARNFGLQKAKGEIIAFLDSDDAFLENHLSVLVYSWLQNKRSEGLYFTNSLIQINDEAPKEKNVPKLSGNVFSYLMHWTPNPARVAITRNIIIEYQFDEKIPGLEDLDLWLRIATKYKVFHIAEFTNVYRIHENSYSLGYGRRFYRELVFFKYIFKKPELKKFLLRSSKNRLLSMCYFHMAQDSFINKLQFDTMNYSLKSIFLYPKGYNGNTYKPIITMFLYSIPIIGLFIRKINSTYKSMR